MLVKDAPAGGYSMTPVNPRNFQDRAPSGKEIDMPGISEMMMTPVDPRARMTDHFHMV